MTRIRTSDVMGQLRRSYEAEAKALAGSNTQISKAEAAKVTSADLRGAMAAITDGNPGWQLNVDVVVDMALQRALERLRPINTTGTEFLSKAEVAALKARQPDLGNRFAAAYEAAKLGVPPTPPAVVDAVKAALGPLSAGKVPPMDIRLVKETATQRIVEVDIRRNDGPTVSAKITFGVGARSNQIDALRLYTDAHPVTGPTVAALETALKPSAAGATVLGFVERVDAQTGKADFLTAYATPRAGGGRDIRLANVIPTTTPPSVQPATLTAADESTARSLALMMARRQAYELVSSSGQPGPKLEYHLRTAALKPSSLQKTTTPDDSAVGFNPATDALQFQLPHVWGDNAVFVTFAKDGTARLEDFN